MTKPEAGRTAFAFPGVGVKLCGLEVTFYKAHRATFDRYLGEASTAVGVDLAGELARGTVAIHDRAIDHAFTYGFSCAMFELYRSHGIEPHTMAGYSFGIYPALFAAGALSYSDGLAAARGAYQLMDRACRGRDYSMGITIGLTAGEIDDMFASGYYEQVCMVNSNNATCKVFAGPRKSLQRFLEEAQRHEALGARLLEVDIPYHHPRLLDGVSATFHSYLQGLDWREPSCPIVSSIDQGLLQSVEELIDFTSSNLSTPVNWERVVSALHGAGITRIVECGPGISLAQNGRFMGFPIKYLTVKNFVSRLER